MGESNVPQAKPDSQPESTGEPVGKAIKAISNQGFADWYRKRKFEQNILEGQAYFNRPAPEKPPKRHSPSKLLQCKRKASYARQNAPREGDTPTGLFWVGSEFEEGLIVPYLQDTTDQGTYVTNSEWIDAEETVDGTELRVRGATDPVIVNENADPLLVTEIKTTMSLGHLTEPKEHHKAQLHAYLWALDNEYDYPIRDGLLVYGSRETLEIEVFHIQFDERFWSRVIAWMADLTEYEQAGELPPADPERDWECEYCSFKHRCGQADTPYADVGHDGLLPLFDDYDRDNLTDYLDAHADENAKVTPTLAHEYPDLAAEYGAYDWRCPACEATYAWDAVEWEGDVTSPPICRECLTDNKMVTLSGPDPDLQ